MAVLAAHADSPGGEPPGGPGRAAGAQPGDTVVIDGAGLAGLPRTSTIIAASQHEEPPYLIRWTAGDYDSWFTPGPAHASKNTLTSPALPAPGASFSAGTAVRMPDEGSLSA